MDLLMEIVKHLEGIKSIVIIHQKNIMLSMNLDT